MKRKPPTKKPSPKAAAKKPPAKKRRAAPKPTLLSGICGLLDARPDVRKFFMPGLAPEEYPELICVWLQAMERHVVYARDSFNPVERNHPWRYGQAVAIDTRRDKHDKLSKDQAAFRAAWESCGGIYLAPRNMADVHELFGPVPLPDRLLSDPPHNEMLGGVASTVD